MCCWPSRRGRRQDDGRLSEEKYCSAAAMLNKTATITTFYRLVEQEWREA